MLDESWSASFHGKRRLLQDACSCNSTTLFLLLREHRGSILDRTGVAQTHHRIEPCVGQKLVLFFVVVKVVFSKIRTHAVAPPFFFPFGSIVGRFWTAQPSRRGPKWGPRTARRPPGAPQRTPRGPLGRLGTSVGPPKDHPGSRRTPKGLPRTTKGVPWGPREGVRTPENEAPA